MAIGDRSAFDFSDQYGSDPVMRRYRPVDYMDIREAEAMARSSEAQRQEAEANLAKAQAELNAQLAPMKFAQEQVKTMSDMLKTKSTIQEEIAVQQNATAIVEGLSKAKNLDEVVALGNSHLLGLRDTVAGPMWRSSALNGFRQLTDNAQSVAEVETAYAGIPASVAADPEFKGLYDMAKAQAERREGVRKAYAAEPSLGAIPTTQGGQVDVTAAGLAVAAKGGEEERRKRAGETLKLVQNRIRDLQSKIAEDTNTLGKPDKSDTDELKQLNADSRNLITEVMRRGGVESGTVDNTPEQFASLFPSSANTGPAAAAAASSAATGGETATAPTPPVAAVPTPVPTPVPTTLEQEALQAAETAAPKQTAPGAGRAAKAAEGKRKRDEANRIKLLKDERTKLQSAIYQKLGRGGGGRLTTRLKPGLTEDNEVVQKTLTRINEITAEIGE